MKIKKPAKIKMRSRIPSVPPGSAAAASNPAAAKNGTISQKAVTCAFVFALAGLFTAGALVYIIYRHWEFLMPA